MANEIEKVETTKTEEMATVESGVEETRKKRKFDIEKTVDFIVNQRVSEKVEQLKSSGLITDDTILTKIAKQFKIQIKAEVQKEREMERENKNIAMEKAKQNFANYYENLVDDIGNIDTDSEVKEVLLTFVKEKLFNAYLRKIGLIK